MLLAEQQELILTEVANQKKEPSFVLRESKCSHLQLQRLTQQVGE